MYWTINCPSLKKLCFSFKINSTVGFFLKGHGEHRKSSTTPMEIKALEGIYVAQVACGMHHTLFLARSESNEEKEKIADLPEYKPT